MSGDCVSTVQSPGRCCLRSNRVIRGRVCVIRRMLRSSGTKELVKDCENSMMMDCGDGICHTHCQRAVIKFS